jgi:WD40 repeat protein
MKGVSCVEISPDCRYVSSGDHNGEVKVWDLSTGKCMKSFDIKKLSEFDHPHITALAFNPKDFCLAAAASDKIVRYFDLESGEMINKSYSDVHPIYRMQYENEGNLLYTGYADSVKVWDLETPKLKYVFDKAP